jgi:polysaccharide export outer membrane protein
VRQRSLCAAALLALAACAHTTAYVPLRDYVAAPDTTVPGVIGRGDLVSVQVWNSQPMATRQRVRDNGTIALFFLGDVMMEGRTTTQAADQIALGLEGVMRSARVSVVVEESAASSITVLGEVTRPGAYPIHRPTSLLEALAMASGLTPYAHDDRIYVLRGGTHPVRIRVTYDDLRQGADQSQAFLLRAGDAVMVE